MENGSKNYGLEIETASYPGIYQFNFVLRFLSLMWNSTISLVSQNAHAFSSSLLFNKLCGITLIYNYKLN